MIRKLLASITVLILAVISACPVAAKGENAIVSKGAAVVSSGSSIVSTGSSIVPSGPSIVYAKISLKKSKISLYPDQTFRLPVKWGKGRKSKLTWTVDDKKIARFSAKGNVRALYPGTTKITVKSAHGGKATATVTVKTPDMKKTVYLTFDDGPGSHVTPKLLKVLRDSGVKATFFIVGSMAKGHEDLLRQMVADGHTLAIHTYTHDFKKIYSSKSAYLSDFYKTKKLIEDATGVSPKYFRFPGGGNNHYLSSSLRNQILTALHKEGYTAIDWNAGTADAASTYYSESTLIKNGKTSHWGKAPIILLQHDSNAKYHTPAVTKALIQYYRSRGYTFANMDHYYGPELCFKK